MSVNSMIARFGFKYEIHRETVEKDENGYEKKTYTKVGEALFIQKKASDNNWNVRHEKGTEIIQKVKKFITMKETNVKEGDKIVINDKHFLVLGLDPTNEYLIVITNGGV